MTAKAATISSALASPSAIRGGIVIGAAKGMNETTVASVPSGSSSTAKEMKKETSSVRVSGVSTDCSSSWRGTSAPAHANAEA